jgi:hypothetical protein
VYRLKRIRKTIAMLAIASTISAFTAGVASAADAQPASVYYQCSGWEECAEFAYWYAFLR